MSNFGDWLPGAKEAKMRAESLIKRRTAATAQTTDLDLEVQDLQVSFDLDQKEFGATELKALKSALDHANAIMSQIYSDVTLIADHPVPERVSEPQAYELAQPALRIEARVEEARKWLEKARQARETLYKPREEVNANIAEAERRRLQAEIDLAAARPVVGQMKAAYAENYPQVSAALQTAESEVSAAIQMINAARLALGRKAWREANDLARRSAALFESATGKFQMIRLSSADYSAAETEADDALAEGLRRLQTARKTLSNQPDLLSYDPNRFLNPAVQRLGEARRAFKATPPQYVTALRLARDALSLIDQALSQASEEMNKLQQSRLDARQSLALLSEAVQNLRLSINSQRTVPVKANDYYAKARAERERLLSRETEIDKLPLPELVSLASSARQALQTAREGLKLMGEG